LDEAKFHIKILKIPPNATTFLLVARNAFAHVRKLEK